MAAIIYDGHTHSHHSFDGSETIQTMCEAAIKAGLRGIAVTDHCDLGAYVVSDWRERLSAAAAEIKQVRALFKGRLKLFHGVELGQATHDMTMAQQVLALFDYDVVLGSLHNLYQTEDFYFLQKKTNDQKVLLGRYFAEMLQLAKTDTFDVLAHITYAYRYMGYGKEVPPVQNFEPQLRELFTTLAKNGKALELNTSGLYRNPKARAMPDLWELKLFKECGGEMVVLGSDAHIATNIGRGIVEGQALLRAAGFSYQTVYQARKPMLYKLD
ncbi:histidinol-phosphatase HisJ family protein [Oscillospiraceae bacterium LTW-04]|nr:histidinol-phosphatase HisJ family protein [Oscillospiraceae bacterium MB24-C1]